MKYAAFVLVFLCAAACNAAAVPVQYVFGLQPDLDDPATITLYTLTLDGPEHYSGAGGDLDYSLYREGESNIWLLDFEDTIGRHAFYINDSNNGGAQPDVEIEAWRGQSSASDFNLGLIVSIEATTVPEPTGAFAAALLLLAVALLGLTPRRR